MTPLICHASLTKIKSDVIPRFLEAKKPPLENLNFTG